MQLYCDRASGMFSLWSDEEVDLLGPITHAMLKLVEVADCTMSQAREAVLRAYMTMGEAVSISDVKRMAKLIVKREDA